MYNRSFYLFIVAYLNEKNMLRMMETTRYVFFIYYLAYTFKFLAQVAFPRDAKQ